MRGSLTSLSRHSKNPLYPEVLGQERGFQHLSVYTRIRARKPEQKGHVFVHQISVGHLPVQCALLGPALIKEEVVVPSEQSRVCLHRMTMPHDAHHKRGLCKGSGISGAGGPHAVHGVRWMGNGITEGATVRQNL